MEDNLKKILDTREERNILLSILKYGRKNFDNSIDFIDHITQMLYKNPSIKEKFIERLVPLFRNIYMQKFITDFGIFTNDKLISLFFRQIGNKILPQ